MPKNIISEGWKPDFSTRIQNAPYGTRRSGTGDRPSTSHAWLPAEAERKLTTASAGVVVTEIIWVNRGHNSRKVVSLGRARATRVAIANASA